MLFDYREGREEQDLKELLNNYQGFLQCEGYRVYDKIGQQQGITLVSCLVHACRKFYDAVGNNSDRAKYALSVFAKIYHIEKDLKTLDDAQIKQKRRLKEIKPLLQQIKT